MAIDTYDNNPAAAGPDYLSDPAFVSWMRGAGVQDPTSMTPAQLAIWWNNYHQYGPGSSQPIDYSKSMPAKQPMVNPTTNPAPSTGSSNANPGTLGMLLQPFGQQFTPPPMLNLGGPDGISYIPQVPQFQPPAYGTPPPFVAPTAQSILSEPGYAARLRQGEDTLEHSAAARGVLNTGGTLKDLINYGQDFASNEYQNAYDRAARTYGMNVATQYLQPYDYAYRAAMDQYQPNLQQWNTQAQAGQRQNEQNYANAWNQYLNSYDQWRNRNLDTFNELFGVAGMGQ